MSEGVHKWEYKKNRSDAHQRLDQAGWRKRKRKDGTFDVEGCLHWNPATGAWRAHDKSATGTGVGEMMHFLRKRERLQPTDVNAPPKPSQLPQVPHPHMGKHIVHLTASRTLLDLGPSKGITSAVTFSEGDTMDCDGFWDAKELTDLFNRRAGSVVAEVVKVG